MKLSQMCINRPVFTCAMVSVLMLFGFIAFLKLPVRFAPLYVKPALSVSVWIPGASPQYAEQNVAAPLEKALVATSGLDLITSSSEKNQININLDFKNISGQEFIAAQNEILQKINGVLLPEMAQQPQLAQNGDNNAVMMLGISAGKMPGYALTNFVNNSLAPQLHQLPGVASVNVFADPPVLRISLNPKQMAAFHISVNEIKNAINNTNNAIALGTLLTHKQAIQLNSRLNISSIEDFKNLLISQKGTTPVYLKDIADVSVGVDTLNHFFAYANGSPGIVLEIDQTNQANPILLGQQVKDLLVKMQPFLPADLKIVPVFDLSKPLKNAVNEVYGTMLIAIVLVVLITFAFLGNWRATLIPVITIPICLVATFTIILLLGFTINIMTLLALVLAVGLVVDDAIVVLENTYRYIEMGEAPMQAARKSISEISFAVLGITICLIAVYVPAIFLPNSVDAAYFREFAFSLAGAVLVSGFLALTLSPMMCARLLKYRSFLVLNTHEKKINHLLTGLRAQYEKLLNWVLSRPKTLFVFLVINIGLGVFFFLLLPRDFLPSNEINYITGLLSGPNSVNTVYLDKSIAGFRKKLEQDPRLENVMMYVNGGGNVFFMAAVKNSYNRDKIVDELNAQILQMPDFSGNARVFDINSNVSSSRFGNLFFYIAGLASYEDIVNAAIRMQSALQADAKVASAMNNAAFSQQEYNFVINYNLAHRMGIDLNEINTTLAALLSGYVFPKSSYQYNGYNYDIVMQLDRSNLADLNNLQDLYVANSAGDEVSLAQLVSYSPAAALPSRIHVNGLRAGEIDVSPAAGYSNGQLIKEIQEIAKNNLPQGLQIIWGGLARDLLQNATGNGLFILLALVFIYLVLACLFESFIDPLIILCTIPLCMVSGLIALKLFNGSLNIYTQIALVSLMGLVAKHGVLITQFANQRCKDGKELKSAVIEAALIRFRPIVMTSLTMILGAIPLLFAVGTDAVGRSQIGVVIVSGLFFGSVFSLLVIPVAYLFFKGLHSQNRVYRKKYNFIKEEI